MTNFELFKTANVEQMATFLIELAVENCENCFAHDFCDCETTCGQAVIKWLNAQTDTE